MPPDTRSGHGVAFCLITNVTWAVQPLYWRLVRSVPAVELLAHRVLWSAATCLLLLVATRRRAALRALPGQRRVRGLLTAAGACLAAAWGVYIHAVNTGQVVQGSLGLFMVPLTTVLVGVLVFGERLNRGQQAAITVAALATVVIGTSYGRPPWLAVAIAVLMAMYAALKKRAAAPVLAGFTFECLAVVAPMSLWLAVLSGTGEARVPGLAAGRILLVVGTGLLTVVPLLSHAAAIDRIPLVLLGVVQYLNPVLQFALAVWVLDESVTSARWAGFALVWVALVVFAVASLRPPRAAAAG